MSKELSPIKWSGSKRPIAPEIISHFPYFKDNVLERGTMDELFCGETFYELFCGSCAVTLELLSGRHIDKAWYKNYVCVDTNADLINLWKHIKTHPDLLSNGYEREWKYFNQRMGDTIEEHRKFHFNYIRDEFNSGLHNRLKNAINFLFLLRTCFNGLIRYNSKGHFNSSCHFSRGGIEPSKMRKILHDTSELLNYFDVGFLCTDYRNITPNEYDFVFMDPPYPTEKKSGMYHGGIDTSELVEYCNELKCGYALTFDGNRGGDKANKICLDDTNIVNLEKKNSSYSRLKGKQVEVEEIMYIKKVIQ